jgi:ornithine carbamoyltransferase
MTHTHLVSLRDWSGRDILEALDLAAAMKRRPAAHARALAGRSLALLFEKPSLRTRATFEVAMTQLGGHAVYFAPADISLGKRESVPDVARNLGRWVDLIAARVFEHQKVVDLAAHARVPVINALSDFSHPCQALADYLTMRERCGSLRGRQLVYVGDGNNVAHSLLLGGAALGVHVRVVTPPGYEPDKGVVARAREAAQPTGARIEIARDPQVGVRGADVVYTDVWASMGQEAQALQRQGVFRPYQVNRALMEEAGPRALFMHCLPAHRGEEVTDEVADSERSVIFDQAENRLHTQKAIMVLLHGAARRARLGRGRQRRPAGGAGAPRAAAVRGAAPGKPRRSRR